MSSTAFDIQELLLKKANSGNSKAQFLLGNFYYEKKDFKQAIKWYQKAAEQGLASAQTILAAMFLEGLGIEKDEKQAAEWFRQAAEQGHVKAQFKCGVMHVKGHGVNKDLKKAAEWYGKAAEKGDVDAQFNLGVLLLQGLGVEKDLKQAAEWFRKAAEQGEAEAQCNLGILLFAGCDVEKDEKQAVEWLRKAAERGIKAAEMCLSEIHARNLKVVEPSILASRGDRKSRADAPSLTSSAISAASPVTLKFSDNEQSRVEAQYLPEVIEALEKCKEKRDGDKYPKFEAALIRACHYGRKEVVKTLLKCVSDLQVDKPGQVSKKTPLQHAIEKEHTEIVEMLRKHLAEQKAKATKEKSEILINGAIKNV